MGVESPASSSLEVPWGLERLQQLHRDGATGVLRLRAPGRSELVVYFMDGHIIGCSCPADPWLLGRLLMNGRAVDAVALGEVVERDEDVELLAERLLDAQLVSPDTLQSVLAERFRENVYAVSGFSEGDGAFEADDAVFPPDVQLGVQTERLIEEAILWFNLVRPLLAMRDGARDPVFRLVPDRRAARPRAGAALLALLRDQPTPLSDLLARSPMSGARTLEALAILAADELVLPMEDEAEEPPVQGSAEDPDLADEPPVQEGAEDPDPTDEPIELVRHADPEDGGAEEEDGEVGEDEDIPAPRDEVDIEDLSVDYDKVTRGAYVQSYGVRDVVDLTGIDHIPTVSDEPMEMEAMGIDSAEYAEPMSDGVEALPMFEGESADGDLGLDDVLALPIESAPRGVEEPAEEYHILVDEEESGERSSEPGAAGPARFNGTVRAPSDRFEAVEIQGFLDWIDIFNSMFQIIFRTFSAQVGPERTAERFNRFLTDESLQAPGLFRRMKVGENGGLDPMALIDNLAESDAKDPAAFLHQGLYELIYVHLYDAKDLLPADAERDMMDQIDAFEQRLHGR